MNWFSCGYPKTGILFVFVWCVYLIHKSTAFIACLIASDQIWSLLPNFQKVEASAGKEGGEIFIDKKLYKQKCFSLS